MNRNRKIAAIAVIFGIILFLALKPSHKKVEKAADVQKMDVVYGAPPVSAAFHNMRSTMEDLAKLKPEERQKRINREYPNLGTSLTYFLRQTRKLQPAQRVESVAYYFGSLDHVKAESGDGTVKDGYFKDQMLADVKVQGQDKPVTVLVLCPNGTFELPNNYRQQMQPLYTTLAPTEEFTIGRRQGLITYVDFPVAVDLARKHNLPLYRGKRQTKANQITPEQAMALQSETDRVQVTVRVNTGDHFKLNTANPSEEYIPAKQTARTKAAAPRIAQHRRHRLQRLASVRM